MVLISAGKLCLEVVTFSEVLGAEVSVLETVVVTAGEVAAAVVAVVVAEAAAVIVVTGAEVRTRVFTEEVTFVVFEAVTDFTEDEEPETETKASAVFLVEVVFEAEVVVFGYAEVNDAEVTVVVCTPGEELSFAVSSVFSRSSPLTTKKAIKSTQAP